MSKERYDKLLTLIHLESIEVDSLSCQRNNLREKFKGENIGVTVNNKIIDISFNDFNIQVLIKLEVQAGRQQGENGIQTEEDLLFNINVDFNLKYSLDTESQKNFVIEYEKELNRFIDNNALVNVWPYARETISSLTTRMGFPVIPLPLHHHIAKY